MKRFRVFYFSSTGNSRFLAHKLGEQLNATVQEIRPFFRSIAILYLCSLLRIRVSSRISRADLELVDEAVIIGPIWGGVLTAPIRSALRSCVKAGKPAHVTVSCGSSDDEKDSKYGYASVLEAAILAGKGLVKSTHAFSCALATFPDDPAGNKVGEMVKITEANYRGPMQERLESYAAELRNL